VIVVCSGCSFTHGMELWEEKNVPNYVDAKNKMIACELSQKFLAVKEYEFTEEKSRNLSYTGTLKSLLNCEVLNIGKGGSSQQEIAQRTIVELSKLKKSNPDEKIICIVQDTSPDRVWLRQEQLNGNKSFVLPSIEHYYEGDKIDAYQIKDAYMKYSTLEQMHLDYYMQSAMIQSYCTSNDIEFMHFIMWNNQHRTTESNIDMLPIHDLFFDDKYCIPVAMIYKLEDYFGHKNFYLPGLHVNCESHEIIGKWLVEEMQERGIL
jgi:hypothetical protein